MKNKMTELVDKNINSEKYKFLYHIVQVLLSLVPREAAGKVIFIYLFIYLFVCSA
jgi:hypothetical protein